MPAAGWDPRRGRRGPGRPPGADGRVPAGADPPPGCSLIECIRNRNSSSLCGPPLEGKTMDAVFEAQFRLMRDDFARRGVRIEVAQGADGEPDYLYRAGHLITLATERNLSLIGNALPGLRGIQQELRPTGELTAFTTDALMSNDLSVPEALDRIDASLGKENPAFAAGGVPAASPDHVVHVSRICPATEPEVPAGSPAAPWPPQRAAECEARRTILIGISDTGLLEKLDPSQYPWLSDVTGDPDPLAPAPGGSVQISEYAAHGTFVAGVAKCQAPQARVLVNDHFTASGGELESVMIGKVL